MKMNVRRIYLRSNVMDGGARLGYQCSHTSQNLGLDRYGLLALDIL